MADMDHAWQGLVADIHKQLSFFALDLHMECAPGETLVVIGPSGSGKTTLLRCLAGLERIDRGRIDCRGQCWCDTAGRRHISPRHRLLGYLSQDYTLFPHMSLRENIRFVLPAGDDPLLRLEAMGIGHLADKRPQQVSGGERQRAALCQTLARRPRLLLLDEPFSALDIENRHLLRELLRHEQRQCGLMIVQVTHDLTEALGSADRVLALHQGREDAEWLQRQRCLLMRDLAGLQSQAGVDCRLVVGG
jgi:molybdate transport system ATP-binding protein